MKTKNVLTTLLVGAICQFAPQASHAQDMDSFAPVVVKTDPEAGTKNVPPGEYEVKITFSKEMADQSWSWSTAWENSDPQSLGKPRYEADHKTCVMKVKLEPGKTYGWWLNSQKFHGFKDAKGQAAVPYLLTFGTEMGMDAAPAVTKDDGTPKPDMHAAVHDWLALMDTGAYPQSWETAAGSFHKAIAKDEWVKLSEKVRQPLGQLISRKEISAQTSTIVPGMPRGSYFVAQFETSFATQTNAVETVEFSLEKDGQWKAIRYLIRPRTAEQPAAVTAAQQWLAGIDAGRYAESWTEASEFFRNALSQDKWVQASESVRSPLGKLEIRTLDSAVTTTTLPGAPYGEYIVMQFRTSFANMDRATETVTFLLEKDGQWRASGYYIK